MTSSAGSLKRNPFYQSILLRTEYIYGPLHLLLSTAETHLDPATGDGIVYIPVRARLKPSAGIGVSDSASCLLASGRAKTV